jgi:hypothetical protein
MYYSWQLFWLRYWHPTTSNGVCFCYSRAMLLLFSHSLGLTSDILCIARTSGESPCRMYMGTAYGDAQGDCTWGSHMRPPHLCSLWQECSEAGTCLLGPCLTPLLLSIHLSNPTHPQQLQQTLLGPWRQGLAAAAAAAATTGLMQHPRRCWGHQHQLHKIKLWAICGWCAAAAVIIVIVAVWVCC